MSSNRLIGSADSDVISVVQLNMGGRAIVPSQLQDYCESESIDVALIQEGHLEGLKDFPGRSVFSCEGGPALAAIVVLNKDIEVVAAGHVMSRFFAVANLKKGRGRSVTFVSAYFKYSLTTRSFTVSLGRILDRSGDRVVIGADVNAHSPQWHSRPGNRTGSARGRTVEELIEERHLTVHNLPGQPDTYSARGMGSSNIDVTLSRGGDLVDAILGWEVVDGATESDHRLLKYHVRCGHAVDHAFVDRRRFNVKKADWKKFSKVLTTSVSKNFGALCGEVEGAAKALVGSIQAAMEASMPRVRRGGRSKPPWWTKEVSTSKSRLLKFRRTRDWREVDREEYKRIRNGHLCLVRRAKWDSWKAFASSINVDVWGPAYKWARNGTGGSRVPSAVMRPDGSRTETALETADCLLSVLIPRDDAAPVFDGRRVGLVDFHLSESEVRKAIWRMAPNKAPGLDGITAAVLRKAWVTVGPLLTRLLERCVRESAFPACWKTADVVVIRKGRDRDPSLPKSYRPVSLLPTISKVLERLVVCRLEEETAASVSREQHGFTAGMSTISAIKECLEWVDSRPEFMVVGVFLDISGAFDNLDWLALIRDMVKLGASDTTRSMIQSYLTDRKAVLTVEKSTSSTELTRGCPQGSQLGPILWKMSMDSALKIDRDERIKVVAYADDLAILIAGSKIGYIRERARGFLQALRDWAAERGLVFSAGKSQAVSLKGGLKPGFSIPFGDDMIVSASPVRYLGVQMDYKRNFWAHIQMVAEKSEGLYSRLRSLTSANWGARQTASGVIYRAVFLPRICYASEIWYKAVRTKKAVKLLGSAQRRPLLSLTGAYRTTSTDALQVVAGQWPLDIEIEWNALVKGFKAKTLSAEQLHEGREHLLDSWQERWDNSVKGRWTHSIMPSIRTRLKLPIELDHYVTQFLTGHGDFNQKLYKFRLIRTHLCRCRIAEDVGHVLFDCERLSVERKRLMESIGVSEEEWPCHVSRFLESRKNYMALAVFARKAITAKQDYTNSNQIRRRATEMRQYSRIV